MSAIMHPTRKDALLKQVEHRSMAKAKLDLNFVEHAGRMFSQAIARTGMSDKEAMDALGVEDKGQFSRMKAGQEKLWVHRLLTPSAVPILRELLIQIMCEAGTCEVERIIRIKEAM